MCLPLMMIDGFVFQEIIHLHSALFFALKGHFGALMWGY